MVHRVAPPVGALEWLAAGGKFWMAVGLHSCFVAPGLVRRLVPGWYLTMIGVGAQPPPYAPAVYEAPKKGGRGHRVDSVWEELVSCSFSCFSF